MEASSIASSSFPPALLCHLSTEAMLGTPKAGVQWGFTTVSMHTCSGTQLFLTLCILLEKASRLNIIELKTTYCLHIQYGLIAMTTD